MALGKESMARWWCMQCKATRSTFMDENSEMWTMDELVRCGIIGESINDDKPMLGIKQWPWWPFIPLTNYVSPLLHCEIGIGNVIFELLRDIINEHIEIYAPGEESIRMAVPAINSLTAIRVLAGTKISRPVGFYSRNSTKSTVNPNTTIPQI
jgi:hypothetical protein